MASGLVAMRRAVWLTWLVWAFAQVPAVSASAPTSTRPGADPAGTEVLVRTFEPEKALSNGSVELADGMLRVLFQPKGAPGRIVHIVSYPVDRALDVHSGFRFVFRVHGWQQIKYVAYGFVDRDRRYWHIKMKHPRQGYWLTEDIAPDSIAFRLSNGWRSSLETPATALRVFVKGTPAKQGAYVELYRVELFDAASTSGDFLLDTCEGPRHFSDFAQWWPEGFGQERVNREAVDALNTFIRQSWPSYKADADYFMQTGNVSLSDLPRLAWHLDSPHPDELRKFTTSRFLWHALNPVTVLVESYKSSGQRKYLYAARSFAEAWIEHNMYGPPQDEKFTWYDHGTALRLLALLTLWDAGLREQFDARFMGRLMNTIYQHGELLATECFYGWNQPSRHHNHAVFQDYALLAVRASIPQIAASREWQQTAISRLNEQFASLTVLEQDCAVNTENSRGYHAAMGRICQLAARLARALGLPCDTLQRYCEGLGRFTELMTYPDGRGPSYGDTYRAPNAQAHVAHPKDVGDIPRLVVFRRSGYALLRDRIGQGDAVYQLAFVAPSRTKIHKQRDNLSFSLWADGVEWLIDPGFYTHHYTEPVPAYARGPLAHNALVVPGWDYSIEPGLTQVAGGSEGTEAGGSFVISGEHRAYRGLVVCRKIRGVFGTGKLAIRDEVAGAEPETGLLMLHCGEEVNVEFAGTCEAVLSTPLSNTRVRIQLPSNGRCQTATGVNENGVILGWSFPEFAKAVPITSIQCEVPLGEPLEWSLEVLPASD